MRASDLKLPDGMEVYVDMDGVVADFFAEYAKLAGVQNGNYRDIPPAKVDPTLNKMIGTDFFFRLPKFPTADKLLQIVVDAAGGYNICSSPLRGDHENSGVQKKRWIQKHLNPQPKQIYIVANKAKYAKNTDGMPNVLIDDRGSNISAWEAAGGIGIKYQADEDSLKVVLEGLKRARRVGKGEQKHEPQKLTSLDRGKMIAVHSSGDKDESIEETAEHDQALWNTARNILKPLMRDAGRDQGPALDQYENGDVVGTVGEIDPSSPKELHDVVVQYSPGETSEYFPVNSTSRTDLLTDYDASKRYILLGGSSYGLDKDEVKHMISQLAHEMRHALDDSLSGGKFNRSHGRGATAYRPSSQDSNQLRDLEHENRPLEINAHYTQALEDIAKAVKSTTTTAQLHKIITQAFKNRWVGRAYRYNIQDPNYRRLVQRAVQYAQKIIQQKQSKLEINKKQGVKEGIEELVKQQKFFAARVKVQQPGYSQMINTTVTATNKEMARRLLRAQYGKNALVNNIREIV
jgi:hypothetical protein